MNELWRLPLSLPSSGTMFFLPRVFRRSAYCNTPPQDVSFGDSYVTCFLLRPKSAPRERRFSARRMHGRMQSYIPLAKQVCRSMISGETPGPPIAPFSRADQRSKSIWDRTGGFRLRAIHLQVLHFASAHSKSNGSSSAYLTQSRNWVINSLVLCLVTGLRPGE